MQRRILIVFDDECENAVRFMRGVRIIGEHAYQGDFRLDLDDGRPAHTDDDLIAAYRTGVKVGQFLAQKEKA